MFAVIQSGMTDAGMMRGGMMQNGMMGGGAMMMIVLLLVLVALVLLVVWLFRKIREGSDGGTGRPRPREITRERYARGEIGREELHEILGELSG